LGYDTIYGAQDMVDDEIIGLKSTSIKFKKNIKLFVTLSYLITSILLVYLFSEHIGGNIFSLFLGLFTMSLIYQIFKFNKNNSISCLNSFKFNNLSGLLLFLSIYQI
jgi:4-hydroxybenzoate polyprenyltransferase